MDFYHNLITEKSWQLVCQLKNKYRFILIGGWAVFLYTKALKSKDIDLVVDFENLERMKNDFGIAKNDRLKKYEAKVQATDIDIYVPFYSWPGLPAQDLESFKVSLEGFLTVEKEVLAILKQEVLLERTNSLKGKKDLIDLLSLFQLADFDFGKYNSIIAQYQLEKNLREIIQIIKKTGQISELDLNSYRLSRLKKRILAGIGLF